MSRRRGSATALKASEVVAALGMPPIYSHIGICQVLFQCEIQAPFSGFCVKPGYTGAKNYVLPIPGTGDSGSLRFPFLALPMFCQQLVVWNALRSVRQACRRRNCGLTEALRLTYL